MRTNRIARTILATVVAIALPAVAQAQLTTYTTLASYLAAISAPGTDNFNALALGTTPAGPLTRTAGAYSYRATSGGDGLFYIAGSATDRWLSNNTPTAAITFDNFTSSVRGVGGYFFGNDVSGNFYAGQTIRVTATTASGTLQQLLTNTTTGTFLGFVSTSAFTSIMIEVIQPAVGGTAWVTANDVVLGAARVVPEPATFALFASGLLILGVLAQRRRARHAEAR
jgi:PEP-CTERM motif